MDVEAKPGSKRNIGEADFFLPLMQDGRGLLFGNARLRVAEHDNREGNLGLGYRRMLEGGWNLGGYGYFDRRRSTTGNYFNQVTLGAEALGRDWDFRGNVYVPQGDKVRDLGSTTVGGGATTAAIVGNTIQVTTPGSTTFTTQERALKGYDLEAGWRAPIWAAEADKQLRLYAGGYHFSDAGIRVSGPRVRAELTMAELPALWKGAQLVLGAEYQDDNARGGQGFVSARLRIPLGSEAKAGYKMNWQERRMAAPVVRDVDVIIQARAVAVSSTPAVVETATQTAGGLALTVINSDATPGAALPGAVAAAGSNSVVLLSGSFHTGAATTTVQPGQTLMGAGTLSVSTPSGRIVTLTTPTASISGSLMSPSSSVVVLGSGSVLSGLNISNATSTPGNPTFAVIVNSSAHNAVIANSTISASSTGTSDAVALLIANATNVSVTGNTLSATTTAGINTFALDLLGAGSKSVKVGDNALSASGGTNNYHTRMSLGSVTILPGSTGNSVSAGTCSVSATVTGAIDYSGGATCP